MFKDGYVLEKKAIWWGKEGEPSDDLITNA